jgi:anti-anti-sigma factor
LAAPRFSAAIVDDEHEVRVVLRGDVDLAVAGEFRRVLETALDAASARVVVDLHGVGHLDSSGIKAIVRANIRARVTGKELHLRGASGPVQRVLDVTGIGRVVTIDEAAGTGEAGTVTT